MLFGLFILFFVFAGALATPAKKIYTATFSESGPVSGTIKFRPNGAETGVAISMDIGIKDSSLGPFAYHVHVNPVPENGDCTATGGHFDPFKPAEARIVCDPGNPGACEIGDLSGKHARIPQYPKGSIRVTSIYEDAFISLDPGNPAFIGNLSIVIHNSNSSARIACANLIGN